MIFHVEHLSNTAFNPDRLRERVPQEDMEEMRPQLLALQDILAEVLLQELLDLALDEVLLWAGHVAVCCAAAFEVAAQDGCVSSRGVVVEEKSSWLSHLWVAGLALSWLIHMLPSDPYLEGEAAHGWVVLRVCGQRNGCRVLMDC